MFFVVVINKLNNMIILFILFKDRFLIHLSNSSIPNYKMYYIEL